VHVSDAPEPVRGEIGFFTAQIVGYRPYRGGGPNMPYVRIEITDGATYEQKLQIYKETTEMLQRILNKKPEYTFVVIEEVENKSWGHMGTSVHEIRAAQAAGGAIPAMGQKFDGKKSAAKAPAKNAAARVSGAPVKRGPAKKR
jgi:4-oxalocrotonate tautomerase